jgi:hypothetical protein
MDAPLRLLALSCALTVALGTIGCDGRSDPDAGGGMDAGFDGGEPEDAGDDSGRCNEFTPEFCPRTYPMTPIPYPQLCNTFAEVFCRANGNCCTRPSEVYETWAMCVSDQLARCMDPDNGYVFADSLAAGDISYSQAAGGEVLALTGPVMDACEPTRVGDYLTDSLRGTLGTGTSCTNSEVCGTDLTCLPAGDAAAVCRSLPGPGSTCATHADCAPSNLRCDPGGTCEARYADAATCGHDLECESRVCMDGECAPFDGDNAYCVVLGGDGRAFGH